MSLNLLVTGAAGRMGKEVTSLVEQDEALKLVAAIDRKGKLELESMTSPEGGEVQAAIDFSSPELLRDILSWCERRKIPLVSGTTGLEDSDYELIKKVSQSVPVLWAPNMSLGVAVLNKLMQGLASVRDQFDFQIEEFHHIHKKDKPSGTALFLQQNFEKHVGATVEPPLCVRGGGIFGVHNVWAMGEEETLCLQHTALNRRVFARGAIQASKWLVDQGPGLYGMSDVIEG